jgi:hypothetical protein
VAWTEAEFKINYQQSPLPVLQPPADHRRKGHPAVLLGKVSLPDVKRILNENGIAVLPLSIGFVLHGQLRSNSLVCHN